MPVFRIESLEDPRLDVYRSLRKTNQNRFDELLIAEGVTVVERLFRSQYKVKSVLVSDQKMEAFRKTIPDDLDVYALTKELATMLVGYSFHMGVLAAGYRKPSPKIESVLPTNGPGVVLLADQVIDPQNVGLLIRIASAFGADALVLANGSADPFSRRAIRVSMGNCLFLPIIEADVDGAAMLRQLKEAGYTTCGTVLSSDAVDVNEFRFPDRSVIVFGNETHGICESVLAECDQQLTISMFNGTDSLNVAISAGIFANACRAGMPAANKKTTSENAGRS